jgi:ribose/xylose/arabinose/galactoside ABC-type transport system permease subunit
MTTESRSPATGAGASALRLLRSSTIWIVIIVVFVVMSVVSKHFLSVGNIRSTIINMTHLAIVAYGLTFVFLGGGFDLSQGAVLILTATLTIAFNPASPLPIAGTIILLLAIAGGIGAVNGWLIGVQGLNSFVVTLGTRTIIGSVIFINAAQAVYGFARQADPLEFIGVGRLFGFLPMLTLILTIVTLACWFVVRWTPYARRVIAVGSNPLVARFSGLGVRGLSMSTYVINAVLAGAAGFLVACKTSYITPSLVWHFDFDAITACALGGISLSGGKGTIMNTLSGVVLLTLLNNSMTLLGVPPVWQPILKGVVLLVAIIADRGSKRAYA